LEFARDRISKKDIPEDFADLRRLNFRYHRKSTGSSGKRKIPSAFGMPS